jgi:hypothetical protein
MSLDAKSKRTIENALAAIDLIVEQRRALEAVLRPDQQAIDIDRARDLVTGQQRQPRKSPPTTLAIRIDGYKISESHAAVGMIKAIELIGVHRVEDLGLKLGGQPLIVRGARPRGRGYHRSGACWVATHSDTAEKRNVLEDICKSLRLTLSVQQVPRHVSLAT